MTEGLVVAEDELVTFTVEELKAEYGGCGSHSIRLQVFFEETHAVEALRALSGWLTRGGASRADLIRWVREGISIR